MNTALVVTSINPPNPVMQALAEATRADGVPFFVVGDRKSPTEYDLPGAMFLDLKAQEQRFGAFSQLLPVGHYVRKNLGYLAALEMGVDWVVETDDDNFPLAAFLTAPPARMTTRTVSGSTPGWVNVYEQFGPNEPVWPRGFPLQCLQEQSQHWQAAPEQVSECVLIQGLADENPDVDAVYRLTRPLPVRFDGRAAPLVLASGQWSPFNSQNTWFRRDIMALAYLPAFCSFRMTDIWRSFVAQRCLWAMDQAVIFVAPTVWQQRNDHSLLKDFEDEVPGYLANQRIVQILQDLELSGTTTDDLLRCYEALIAAGIFPVDERPLVQAWIENVERRL